MENETQTKSQRKVFWARFAAWIALAAGVPFAYLAVAYGLFKTKDSGRTLSGWGVFAMIVVCATLLYIINQTRKGLPKGSMMRQCIGGYMALIPLFGLLLAVHAVKNTLEDFERFLIITLACEAVAIPINPLPKWAAEHNINLFETTITNAIRKARSNE